MQITIEYIQLVSASVFPLALLAVLFVIVHRSITNKGIGIRVIQFTTAPVVIPGVVILSTGNFIGETSTVGLLAAFIAYLFASNRISDKDAKPGSESTKSERTS